MHTILTAIMSSAASPPVYATRTKYGCCGHARSFDPYNIGYHMAAERNRQRAIAAAWQKFYDDKSKKPFYCNLVTREKTWDRPKALSPPAPPPAKKDAEKPSPPKPVAKEKPKGPEWCLVHPDKGEDYWWNPKTGKSQYERPDCMKKYP